MQIKEEKLFLASKNFHKLSEEHFETSLLGNNFLKKFSIKVYSLLYPQTKPSESRMGLRYYNNLSKWWKEERNLFVVAHTLHF